MEFYADDTPATRYFESLSFNLTPNQVDAEKQIVLFLSFHLGGTDANLSAYSYESRDYVHSFDAEVSDAKTFLDSLETLYEVTIPAAFESSLRTFLELKENAFSIATDLEDDPDYSSRECEQCGDWNRNEFTGFYFPEIDASHPASLAIGHEFGCFGGEKITGNFSEVKDLAVAYTSRVIQYSAETKAAAELTEFLKKIQALQS